MDRLLQSFRLDDILRTLRTGSEDPLQVSLEQNLVANALAERLAQEVQSLSAPGSGR